MFPAGSKEGSIRTVAIEVFDDDIDEYPEGFILVLDVDTSGVRFTPSRRTALVRINDDDRKRYSAVYNETDMSEFVFLKHSILGLSNFLVNPTAGHCLIIVL